MDTTPGADGDGELPRGAGDAPAGSRERHAGRQAAPGVPSGRGAQQAAPAPAARKQRSRQGSRKSPADGWKASVERAEARTRALTLFFLFVVFAFSATVVFTGGGSIFRWSDSARLLVASALFVVGMVFDFAAYVTLSNARIRYDAQRAESAKQTEDQAAERLLRNLDFPAWWISPGSAPSATTC